MCANSLNLWTVATLLLLACRVLDLGIGPSLNWLTILTPWLIGEGLYQSVTLVMWHQQKKAAKRMAELFAKGLDAEGKDRRRQMAEELVSRAVRRDPPSES